jgi:hypothetical protein
MTFQEEIAEVQARIAAARAERDDGQAAALQRNYFDACYRLERLEGELEGLRQQGLRTFASHNVMADFGIVLRDGGYHVGPRRYWRLADALSDARRRRRARLRRAA